MTTTHTSICRFCHANCGILVDVEGGRPVAVRGDLENPAYRGFTCVKGRRLPEQHAHPERLLHSQKRGTDGAHTAIASETAMDEVAARLREIVDRHGPSAIALYVGTYSGPHPLSIPFSIGWLMALGSRMLFTAATIDQPGKSIANALHGRWLGGSHVFDESDTWLLLGNNPLVSISGGIPPSNPGRRLKDAKDRGMKLVVIDPRRTEVARWADVYLQPRPGEDPTLLAGMLRVVLDEKLYDADFIAEHVQGFDALDAATRDFDVEYAADRAGVAADDLRLAARTFAAGARGCAVAGTGPNMAPHGNATEYLLLALNTLCGRWRRAGEIVPNPGALLPEATPKAQAAPPRRAWGFGPRLRVRGFRNTAAGLPTSALAEEILLEGDGKVRALICVGSNPMAAWPDQLRTYEAMKSLDLLVTLDMKMSATSRLADYVIAPRLSLETPGVSVSMETLEQTYVALGYPEPYAQYTPAIVDPPTGSDVIEEWEFFYGLGRRMGLPLRLFPVPAETGVLREPRGTVDVDMETKPSTDEMIEAVLGGSRVPLEEVKRHPHGHVFDASPIEVAPADENVAEDDSARLDVGNDDMLRELAAIRDERPATAPYLLISRRLAHVYNSSGRDIEALTKGTSYNPAFVHPEDIAALGLAEGDVVRISSERASILGVLAAAPEVRRGVVSMAHCFGDAPDRDGEFKQIGSNTGRLVDTTVHYDPHTGIPRMSAIPVSIEPAGRSS